MKQFRLFALGVSLLFLSASAMALRPPDSAAPRLRPAGSVIDTILEREASLDRPSREQNKRERKQAKKLRKAAQEREKTIRKNRAGERGDR